VDTLHISDRTVETHKSDMYKALNVRNERELLRVAFSWFDKGQCAVFLGQEMDDPAIALA
jgi:hypothetical protein